MWLYILLVLVVVVVVRLYVYILNCLFDMYEGDGGVIFWGEFCFLGLLCVNISFFFGVVGVCFGVLLLR